MTQRIRARGHHLNLRIFNRPLIGSDPVLFGDRLDALSTQAGTPEGDARERQLISLLGPECFYDHERHVKPTRRPQLGPPLH